MPNPEILYLLTYDKQLSPQISPPKLGYVFQLRKLISMPEWMHGGAMMADGSYTAFLSLPGPKQEGLNLLLGSLRPCKLYSSSFNPVIDAAELEVDFV